MLRTLRTYGVLEGCRVLHNGTILGAHPEIRAVTRCYPWMHPLWDHPEYPRIPSQEPMGTLWPPGPWYPPRGPYTPLRVYIRSPRWYVRTSCGQEVSRRSQIPPNNGAIPGSRVACIITCWSSWARSLDPRVYPPDGGVVERSFGTYPPPYPLVGAPRSTSGPLQGP